MEAEKKSILEVINSKWITPILAIITGIYGFLFYQTNQKLAEQSKKLDIETQEIKLPLIQKDFDNTLKLEIFKEVKEITSNPSDTNKQKIVNLIVKEMLADYPNYRNNLLEVINGSPLIIKDIILSNDTLRLKENKFEQELQKIANSNVNDKIKINVYYLDIIPEEAKPKAESIVNLINTTFPTKYAARAILFPKSINSQSIYSIGVNMIICKKDEWNNAIEILDLINSKRILPLEKPVLRLKRNEPISDISVFVRNM